MAVRPNPAKRWSADGPSTSTEPGSSPTVPSQTRRLASNFALLTLAEVVCRGASVCVTLALADRLGRSGFGRIEFAFNVVFWLVLIVRDCFETIATREVARHTKLIPGLVDQVLAVKLAIASLLYLSLMATAFATNLDRSELGILAGYGLLLFTTAIGIDFVFRGIEQMGLVAFSLSLRTAIYATGVLMTVKGPQHVGKVPFWLVFGELTGIGIVWIRYTTRFRIPAPRFGRRLVGSLVRRGKSIAIIQLSQAVLVTADLMIVGLLTSWSDVGQYGAPHRMVSALMAFGLISQQVLLPSLSRTWRHDAVEGRGILDTAIRFLMLIFVPVAVGGAILSKSIVDVLLPSEFDGAPLLLAIGIWRVPLLSLAFLYQTALIAMNRERAGLRLLVGGATAAAPCIALGYFVAGTPGASFAVVGLGLMLVIGGYFCLAAVGQAPVWHHHLGIPVLGSLVMAPVSLALERRGLPLAVLGGAITYGLIVAGLGGFRRPGTPAGRTLLCGTHWVKMPQSSAEPDPRTG